MKVKDLIIELRKLNPDLDVRCVEDGPTPLRSDYPGPFEITDVGSHHVVIARDSAGLVSITFDPTDPEAREVALIGITSDI